MFEKLKKMNFWNIFTTQAVNVSQNVNFKLLLSNFIYLNILICSRKLPIPGE